MKKIRFCLVLVVFFWTVIGCQHTGNGSKYAYYEASFFAMDTMIDLRIAWDDVHAQKDYEELQRQCVEIVADIEGVLSKTKATSDVYAFNQCLEEKTNADAIFVQVLKQALEFSADTQGAYDPTLGTLIDLWDIPSRTENVPDQAQILQALQHTGWEKISFTENSVKKQDPQLKIDLGGIGKGYAAQQVIAHLQQSDFSYGLISLGGNIAVFGQKEDGAPFKIGIRDPENAAGIIGYLYIDSGFVSVSGDYERYVEINGERYHHIFDPKTGKPAYSGLRSVAVYADDGMTADALSTALFVMGVERGMALYESQTLDFEAIFVTDSGELFLTEGLTQRGIFEKNQ